MGEDGKRVHCRARGVRPVTRLAVQIVVVVVVAVVVVVMAVVVVWIPCLPVDW